MGAVASHGQVSSSFAEVVYAVKLCHMLSVTGQNRAYVAASHKLLCCVHGWSSSLGTKAMTATAAQRTSGRRDSLKRRYTRFAAQHQSCLSACFSCVCNLQAEGRYYRGIGLQSFMAGHLYECPNGHLFVIGECGQAMQVMQHSFQQGLA